MGCRLGLSKEVEIDGNTFGRPERDVTRPFPMVFGMCIA